jgi:hypothetical protein
MSDHSFTETSALPNLLVDRDWFLSNRFRIQPYQPEITAADLQSTDEQKYIKFIHASLVIAASPSERALHSQLVHSIIINPLFNNLSHTDQAKLLLFANWQQLNPNIQDQLKKQHGQPLFNNLDIVPCHNVIGEVRGLGLCGNMENRMKDSRDRILIGGRLLLKLYGTKAAISDRLIITKQGNILLPFVWYHPDDIFVDKLEFRHKHDPLQRSTTHSMDDFPLIGLETLRHSPAFERDDGWDNPVHTIAFENLHDPADGLSALIEKHLQE